MPSIALAERAELGQLLDRASWLRVEADRQGSGARLSYDLLHNHREDIPMALYLDDRHHLVGTALLAICWVRAARLSAHPIPFGTQATSRTPASSSATAATGFRAPPKARSAPSYHRRSMQPAQRSRGRSGDRGRLTPSVRSLETRHDQRLGQATHLSRIILV